MLFEVLIFKKTKNQFQNRILNYKKIYIFIVELTNKNRKINKFTKTKHKIFIFV